MAYITTEHVAEMRKEIKALYPHVKFSIVREHYSAVRVHIMESPYFENEKYFSVHYQSIDRTYEGEVRDFLNGIYKVISAGNFDKSDSMTDYFHVGWYMDIYVGKWDKNHKKIETKNKKIDMKNEETTLQDQKKAMQDHLTIMFKELENSEMFIMFKKAISEYEEQTKDLEFKRILLEKF